MLAMFQRNDSQGVFLGHVAQTAHSHFCRSTGPADAVVEPTLEYRSAEGDRNVWPELLQDSNLQPPYPWSIGGWLFGCRTQVRIVAAKMSQQSNNNVVPPRNSHSIHHCGRTILYAISEGLKHGHRHNFLCRARRRHWDCHRVRVAS